MEAVEFADASPEPPLDSPLRQPLRASRSEREGWYAVDERTPDPFRGEREREAAEDERVRDLHEAGAAYGGQNSRAAAAAPAEGRPRPTNEGRPDRRGPGRRGGRDRRRRSEVGAEPAEGEPEDDRLMATMRMREALNAALREEMERDESVFLMGEDIGVFEGAFKVTEGLMKQFGERARPRHADLGEHDRRHRRRRGDGRDAAGRRADDGQLRAARARPDHQPRRRDPLHVQRPGPGADRDPDARRRRPPARPDPLPLASRRCTCRSPACSSPARRPPADGKALLKAAIRDDNPVIFIEHETLYGIRGEVPDDGDHVLRFGEAAVRREGGDVTIVAILKMAHEAERAAKTLADDHGIEAEVIDPRTLRPLDLDTILESVRKTNRVVIVEEGWPHGGVGANLAALIQEQAFDYLDAPIQRVTGADVPMPYSKRLEQSAIPHPEHIVSAVAATTHAMRAIATPGLDASEGPWLTSSCRGSPTRWRRERSSAG